MNILSGLSRFLDMDNYRINFFLKLTWIETHRFSSYSSAGCSRVRSEYQHFRSLANGAKGTPQRELPFGGLMASINELW